ncbi:helix-turn-helix transcriptional regulator [Cohnella nanjingensis]|uniref:YafY family transcriptional regulator n=1 Tax=Cohnella nanjingensis TaxID=1387779 RepID=A0A7X0RLI0_9BACL|nr:YafY family protein [Cohnella nanjingensis]MBB6669493.1 YafY family transcriptional regulator [Cohnella nanjingensis]
MSKADNMLAILWLLRSRRKMSATQLAEELEVHVRTIYRHIDALCISGVPIVSEVGRDGGYAIPDTFKLEPLFFDAEEQKALLHSATFAREADYPSREALGRAVSKIKRYANPEQRERMERHETHLEVIQPPTDPSLLSVLVEIESSMELQVGLEIDYQTGYDGPLSNRTVDVYGLVHWKSKWYAVGHCHLRGEVRSFRVDRMRNWRCTEERFQRPPHFSARSFLMDSLLAEAGAERQHPLVSLRIQGSAQALDDLCGHWLLSHALVERTEDRAHFQLDELNLYTQIPYYLLSFGGKIRVQAPEELRACMADIATSLLEYYRS